MSLIQIKVTYSYYSSKRITPVYILEEELENSSFEEFKKRILKEVPHLAKAGSLRWTVSEDGLEVDLSPAYFNFQMRGILAKGKSITIQAIEFESPATCTSYSASSSTRNADNPSSKTRARRTLVMHDSELGFANVGDLDTDDEIDTSEPHTILPLDRYAKKQKETVQNITLELSKGTIELQKFDEKVQRASSQNTGCLSTCGNCHLKLGHTKKICTFSPCKSVFSCGILSKHANEKAQRTAIERDISRMRVKLNKVEKDVDDANRAAERLANSVSKRIEDVVIAEQPDRYVVNGLRNWALLNKDVANLQKHLKGKLPSRENVQKLLYEVVINAPNTNSRKHELSNCTATRTSILGETDHRMTPQTRLLSDNYAITFPKKRKLPSHSEVCISSAKCSTSDLNDFKLALKLQQEEMESPPRKVAMQPTPICIVDPVCEEKSVPEPFELAFQSPDPNIWHDPEEREAGNDIELEADAAAALLQLKRTRESQS